MREEGRYIYRERETVAVRKLDREWERHGGREGDRESLKYKIQNIILLSESVLENI